MAGLPWQTRFIAPCRDDRPCLPLLPGHLAPGSSGLIAATSTGAVANPGTGSPNGLLNGGTTPPSGPRFENTADCAINYDTTVDSPVSVSGATGNAPAALAVEAHIVHTYIGDLLVQLIALRRDGLHAQVIRRWRQFEQHLHHGLGQRLLRGGHRFLNP